MRRVQRAAAAAVVECCRCTCTNEVHMRYRYGTGMSWATSLLARLRHWRHTLRRAMMRHYLWSDAAA